MDELTKAIISAGKELRDEYDWGVTDDGEKGDPEPDGIFVTTLRKHLAPLVGDGWKQARIMALKEELRQLEERCPS